MSDKDLDEVAPERRRETARRIEILERYLAIEAPDHEDDRSHADELGVGPAQFLRLARTWRRHRRPEILLGGAGAVGGDAAIRSTLPNIPTSECDALMIDDVAIDLPVRTSRPRTRPILQVMVAVRSPRLLDWRLQDERMTDASIARMLLRLPVGARTVREISLPGAPTADQVAAALRDAGLDVLRRPTSNKLGVETRRLLGTELAGFALRSKEHLRGDARASSHLAHMTLAEGSEALAWHLRRTGETTAGAPALPEDQIGIRLRARLARIAGVRS